MKVLLLYPNIQGMNMLPPAIGLFTSLLRAHGHTVDLFDSTNWKIPGEDEFNSDKEKENILTVRPFDDSILKSQFRDTDVFDDFRQKVKTFDPDLIAVSVTEDIFPIGIRLLNALNELKPLTIIGGVFPTFAPEKCLRYDEVDIVCIGEGENALVELCDRMECGKNYLDIPNLWIKTKNGIKRNPLGQPVDINSLPLLDMSLFEESRFYRPMQGKVWRMLPVETHRGCPYMCTYCNSPSQQRLYRKETGHNHYRMKSIDAVYKELKYYKDVIKAEAFYFWADSFLCYTEKTFNEFCEMYKEIRLPFWCQSRPETVKEARIKRLMDVGLFRMGLGVEHGNYEFRKRILRRNVTNETMLKSFKVLNRLDLKFSANNIMGFPEETKNLAMDTVHLNRQITCDGANAYSFSPFHGTPLRKMAEDLGFCDKELIARSIMKPTFLNMPQFPPDAIEGLRRCFILYVKMPLSRWPEIEKAEELTLEGDRIWAELRDECAEKHMNF